MAINRTKEDVEAAVKEAKSVAGCLRLLGLRPIGGNYKTFHKLVKKYKIDTSHFTGQGWNKGLKLGHGANYMHLDEILIENSTYTSTHRLKKKLFKEGVKNKVCEKCGGTKWNGLPIPLELDHINGVNDDHRLENLQIICPNCHAQTPHYRGKQKLSNRNENRELNYAKFRETLTDNADGNPEPSPKREGAETLRRKPKPSNCIDCGKKVSQRSKRCRSCELQNRKTLRPLVPQLLEDFAELKSYLQVAKKYGVSDNAVRKWVKYYGIEDMVKRKSSARTE